MWIYCCSVTIAIWGQCHLLVLHIQEATTIAYTQTRFHSHLLLPRERLCFGSELASCWVLVLDCFYPIEGSIRLHTHFIVSANKSPLICFHLIFYSCALDISSITQQLELLIACFWTFNVAVNAISIESDSNELLGSHFDFQLFRGICSIHYSAQCCFLSGEWFALKGLRDGVYFYFKVKFVVFVIQKLIFKNVTMDTISKCLPGLWMNYFV